MRLPSGDKHHLRKSADRKAQISPLSGTNAFLICAFRSADFLRWCLSPEDNLTHNIFFLFPIVFGINLIHFFDQKDGAAGNWIIFFFRCFDPLSRHLAEVKRSQRVRLLRRMRTVRKSATFWQRKVWTQRHFVGEKVTKARLHVSRFPTCHVMVSMALTNQRRPRKGRNTPYAPDHEWKAFPARLKEGRKSVPALF